ncbi:hypothetical protein HWV62_29509 [Athelia sp. TMB]|nr:hypothetical protein HWV62_29509 [Athelia sp. TMB]
MCPYLSPTSTSCSPGSRATKTLQTIFLDTASLLSHVDAPTKKEATSGLIKLMKLLPQDSIFFLNTWTWGYEDILKAINAEFGAKIHLDRYKYGIYQRISDQTLNRLASSNPDTRFHACERFSRCPHVAVENGTAKDKDGKYSSVNAEGKTVVYVNPVVMGEKKYAEYMEDVQAQLQRGEVVTNLRVVPNTLVPGLRGLDWAAMPKMFNRCLAAHANLVPDVALDASLVDEVLEFDYEDAVMKNLEGQGALEMAEHWAESRHIIKMLRSLRDYLPLRERVFVNRVLKKQEDAEEAAAKRRYGGYDDDTDSDREDERGRIAHLLFAEPGADHGQNLERSSSPPIELSSGNGGVLVSPGRPSIEPPPPERNREPLTPESSPPRKMNKGKKRQIDLDRTPGGLGSAFPDLLTPPRSKRVRDAAQSPPLAALDNFLFKMPPLLTSSDTSPGVRRKRRKLETPPTEDQNFPLDQSPASMGQTPLEPPSTSLRPAHLRPRGTCMISSAPTASPDASFRESFSRRSATLARRYSIADKLCRARPDLASPAYLAKRESWNSISEIREQYLEGLRSIKPSSTSSSPAKVSIQPEPSVSIGKLPLPLLDEDDIHEGSVNWERSRLLAAKVRAQVERDIFGLPIFESIVTPEEPAWQLHTAHRDQLDPLANTAAPAWFTIAMKHALDPILQELSSLNEKVDDLSGRMDDLSAKVDELDTSDLANISNTVDSINEEVESVQENMDGIKYKVSSVDVLSVAVLALSQQVAVLNDQSERIEGMLTAQASALDSLSDSGLAGHPSYLLIRDGSPTQLPA